MAKTSKLAAAIAAVKTAITAAAAPTMVEMAQTVAEIHTSPEEFIPAGTLLTPEILEAAGLDEDDVDDLVSKGHAKLVKVYAPAEAEAAAAAAAAE
jgi:hypothetical protein